VQKLSWKPNSELDKAGLDIVRLLNKQKHQAFFVGGYVRDQFTKKVSDNIDIATDALPNDVEKILDQEGISYKQIGKKYGTILAMPRGQLVEITTFRREARYSDQRHPDQVEFIREYLDDAQRRDLSINAMYLDPMSLQLFDPVNGLGDIKKKIIRFVGDPKKRIDEDPLRMLRAVRFATTLGYKLEKNSFAAIKTRAKLIQGVSAERIKHELDKILICQNRSMGLRLMTEVGLMRFVIPELVEIKKIFHNSKKFHLEGSIFEHTLLVVEKLPADLDLIYSGIFHDIGKIQTKVRMEHNGEMVNRFFGHQQASKKIFEKFAANYRFARQKRQLISWLIIHHDDRQNFRQMRKENQIKYALNPEFPRLLWLWKADSAGNLRIGPTHGEKVWGNSESVKLGNLILKQIGNKLKLLDKFSRGDYIMRETKLAPGIKIGRIAEAVKIKIVGGEIKNEDDARKFLKKYKKNT
jgi:tRNA nucleotidyltransferase/poly(A) polymerase